MRSKLFAVFAALVFVFAFSAAGSAQTLTTDIVFLKVGYIPINPVEFDDNLMDVNSLDSTGWAIQGEYNLNFDSVWIGFALEYQRLNTEYDIEGTTEKFKHCNQFIQPMVSLKLAALGGLYVGAGLSGKYLIATETIEDDSTGPVIEYEWEKKIDLWANGIIGYYMPIGEAVFLDLEGRFGYNLTNDQFTKYEDVSGDIDVKSSYDLAFYVGIGTRARASDY
jgi:hypothetical protein